MRGRPRLQDPDENTSMPPEGYEGRWHTPAELRRVNKELAKVGRRICRKHQGAALPLDDEHFYRIRGYFDTRCKACHKAEMRKYPQTRDRRAYYREVLYPVIRERHIEAARQRRLRQKRERLAAVLEERAS